VRTPALICQIPDTRQIGVMVMQHQIPKTMATAKVEGQLAMEHTRIKSYDRK
jgi:hypothetical protein